MPTTSWEHRVPINLEAPLTAKLSIWGFLWSPVREKRKRYRTASQSLGQFLRRLQRLPKSENPFQVVGFANLGWAIGVPAAARQRHPLAMKADGIHQGKLIVRPRLLEGPEKIIRRGHQQSAILHRTLFLAAQRRSGILLRDAVKSLNKMPSLGTRASRNTTVRPKTMQFAA